MELWNSDEILLLVNLPDVILKHLQSFLSYDDIHYFLNSNQLYFSSLKQETIYFSLNKKKSEEYVEDERFREMILSKVKDGSQQIGLSFDKKYRVPDICDIIAHKINFVREYPYLLKYVSCQVYFLNSKVKDIPFLPMLQDLELVDCMNIKDFSNLSHLKKLELSDAPQLTDISPLQNIPHLTLTKCPNIQDFSILSSKRQMFLSIHQSPISNVSFLRNIQTVELCLCDQLVDVSPLYGIKNLLLMSCSNIRDISGLGKHHRLTIFHCRSIDRGYECFKTVRHATVSGWELPDLSVFQDVSSLQKTFYSSMESQLFFLKDIADLTFHSSFSNHRKEVYDISHLRNIKLTFYEDIIKISESSLPSQLLHLHLQRCDQIVKIIHEGKTSIFHHLQSLCITNCLIEHVNGLGDIPELTLQHCSKLHDISGLGRNRCVKLQSCPKIRDVSSLTSVPIVTVRNCDGIIDFSCLSSIPRLKIAR